MVKDTILYDRLELSSNATDNDIKKAFNKLSKIWHPDKNTNAENKEEVTKKFQEINQAKEILLDPEKRNLYDQIGINILNPEMQNMQGDPFEDLNSVFGNGFGGFPGFGNGFPFNMNNQKKEKHDNINKTVDVTLEQIYNEENINFTYQQNVFCSNCNGNGTNNGQANICNSCNGKGVNIQIVKMGPMIQQSVGNCQKCNGTGKIKDDNNVCNICNGECFIKKTKTIQIPLKAGLTHNNKINLSGKGHHYKNVKTDLILTINELNHPFFKRYENNLYIEINLKLYQALFGFTKEITHLDNRKLYISSNDKTDFNTIRKINNEGMKFLQSNMKGNLYIKFNIEIPSISSLDINTNQLKQLLQNINIDEFNNEKSINNNNKTKLILTNCNTDESNKINNYFNNSETKENNSENNYDDMNNNNNFQNGTDCRQS